MKSNHTGGKARKGNTLAVIHKYAEADKHRSFFETDHGFLRLAIIKSFI